MAFVEHECCPARLAALVMLAAAVPVQAYWRNWVSAEVSEVEPVSESCVKHSGVGLELCSKLREAVAGSYWEVALVSHRTEPAVANAVFLEPEVELPDSQERRLDQLLDVEGHPAVVPETDRMMDHDVVKSMVEQPAGLEA